MATLIEIENARTGYREVLDHVVKNGQHRAPRGMETIDLGPTTVMIRDPRNALPTNVGRGVNQAIAAVEALQLIGATSTPELVVAIAPQFERFREAEGHFHGAYGVRIGSQMTAVVNKLRMDRDTRQAAVTIWDPYLDNQNPVPADIPCTIGFGFALRDDRLDMHVVMRSNDAWLGTPYDWFQFTQLQLSLANCLDVAVGRYVHTAWSLHLYVRDLGNVQNVTTEPIGNVKEQPTGLGSGEENWVDIQDIARSILNGTADEDYELTSSEEWYHDRIAPHLG